MPPARSTDGPPDCHLTEDLTTRTRNWITQQKSLAPDTPFFAYFATGAVHAPHHVPHEYIDRFQGQFDHGWDTVRQETLTRQNAIGVVPPDTDLTVRPAGGTTLLGFGERAGTQHGTTRSTPSIGLTGSSTAAL